MNSDYRSKDIDALLAAIDRSISSVRAAHGSGDADINVLIGIAETVKKHAVSAKNGVVSGPALLRDLVHQISDHSPESIEQGILPLPWLFSLTSVSTGNDPVKTVKPTSQSTGLTHTAPARTASFAELKTAHGTCLALGKCLGQGGEGEVYKIPALPGKVAKVYHRYRADLQSCSERERKIQYLVKKKDAAYIGDTLIAALPDEALYCPDGSFAGYIMPQFATTAKLFDIQREGYRRKLFPELDYRGLIAIAYNLAEAVDHLHRHGIVVGDMNQNNILVHSDGTIGLIDCDSFDVTNPDTGEHFPCCVGLAELLAPELQTVGSLKNGVFTRESDNFSLAIQIFRLLMNNADPFGYSMTGDTRMLSLSAVEAKNPIANGECVYFRSIPGKQIPNWSPALSALPEDIQLLFRRTFEYTAETAVSRASQRATASDWMSALQKFYGLPLKQCKKDSFHWFLPHLTECPFCSKTDRPSVPFHIPSHR